MTVEQIADRQLCRTQCYRLSSFYLVAGIVMSAGRSLCRVGHMRSASTAVGSLRTIALRLAAWSQQSRIFVIAESPCIRYQTISVLRRQGGDEPTFPEICFDNVCRLRYLNFVNSLAHHHHHHHHAHGASAGVFG